MERLMKLAAGKAALNGSANQAIVETVDEFSTDADHQQTKQEEPKAEDKSSLGMGHSSNNYDDQSFAAESSVMTASDLPVYGSDSDSHRVDEGSNESVSTVPKSNAGDSEKYSIPHDYSSMSTANSRQPWSPNFRFKRGALISSAGPEESGTRISGSRAEEALSRLTNPNARTVETQSKEIDQSTSANAKAAETKEAHGDPESINDHESAEDIENGGRNGSRQSHSIWHETSLHSDFSPKFADVVLLEDDEPQQKKITKNANRFQYKGWVEKMRRNRRIVLIVAIVAVAIISIVIAIAVSASKHRGGAMSPNSSTRPTKEMLQKIQSAVSNIVDQEILSDSRSFEAQALQWLIAQDSLWTQDHEEVSEDRIVQRFILVEFHLSTGGITSWKKNNWLKGDECDGIKTWNFINCNNGQVRALDVDNVGLVGQIPTYLALLTRLENLIIKNEPRVTGVIPSEFGRMKNIRQLGLYNTGLSGSIPKELFKASSLTFLNLQNNSLIGSIPTEVGQLVLLDKLVLRNNQLGGEIPWQSLVSSGPSLLSLSNNTFQGQIPSTISDLTNLRYLYLDVNELTGALPSEIGQITNLESLDMDGNYFNGSLPEAVGQLSNLQYFSMQYNELSGPIPTTIREMTSLRSLGLGGNRYLTGELPDMSTLSSLENLYLFENQFQGQISSSIFDLAALKVLFLSSNSFSGGLFLPNKLNTRLIGLYLSDNQLDGSIPSSVCNLRGLEALFLDENYFSGSLPSCLGSLQELTQLYAFKNYLEGSIPSELGSLPKLQELGLEGNKFQGTIADGFCNTILQSGGQFWSDCGGDKPAVQCTCCSMCCADPDNCAPPAKQ